MRRIILSAVPLRLPGIAAGLVAIWLGTTLPVQARAAPDSFADLAATKLPAVVTVTSTSRAPEQGGPPGMQMPFEFPPGSPFRDFFDEFFRRRPGPDQDQGPGSGPGPGPQAPRAERAMGSGFIIDSTGYVVTNNHVIENGDEIKVVLHDDRELAAKVIGTDAKTDLALIKVEAGSPLPALEWGDSDAVRVGDWVVAIGNPFGLGGTVTAGIISARARDINAGPYDDFLQTDAAINRGNSGGPLFGMDGTVVGVNTAIFSNSGGNIGIGFAVPATIARLVISDLREKGSVTRGWLGVMIQPVTPDIAEALGLPDTKGALVANVTPDSPAAKAGITTGDIVRSFNGRSIDEVRLLSRTVAATNPDQQVDVRIWRNGKEETLKVTIARLEDAPEAVAATGPGATPAPRTETTLGLALSTLTPEVRSQFGLPEETTGVVVMDVKPGSPAAERGFRPGDVIAGIGQQKVTRPADIAAAIEEARRSNRSSVLVLRQREGGSAFVPLPVSPEPG
jgi:serine protease Do